MADLEQIISNVTKRLLNIKKQASALANGLQNAAPGNKSNPPNPSIRYLLESAQQISICQEQISSLPKESTNAAYHSQSKSKR